MPYPLIVVEYDPAWPGIYEQERTLLAPAFGVYLLDIQHVGSTSVPGLAAKPIIDIAVATDRYPLPDETIVAVEALGYEHRGENGVPRRHYFRKYAAMEYHLHVNVLGSDDWLDQIAFRDFLRADPEEAAAYGELKRQIVQQYAYDILGYIDAKGPFIRGALERVGRR